MNEKKVKVFCRDLGKKNEEDTNGDEKRKDESFQGCGLNFIYEMSCPSIL